MKIRIAAHIIESEGKFYPGDEVDLPDDVAQNWIDRQLALRIEEPETKDAEKKEDDEEKKKG